MIDSTRAHTFLFADIAGFTALTEAHGDVHAADLVEDFCSAVGAFLPDAEAEQVKSIGDAVLLRVEQPAAAIRLGLRIVHEVGGRHAYPVVRAGMHTGPAEHRDGDWFGATVNLAARVTGAARGGEVLCSEDTRQAAGDPADVDFEPRGLQRFRNFAGEMAVFRAHLPGSPTATLPVDPVCRMAVDPLHARRLHFDAEAYSFCSDACAEAFSTDPALYVDVRKAMPPE